MQDGAAASCLDKRGILGDTVPPASRFKPHQSGIPSRPSYVLLRKKHEIL